MTALEIGRVADHVHMLLSLLSSMAPKRWLVASALLLAAAACVSGQTLILNTNRYHLGVAGKPEWLSFEGQTPFSNRLDIHFAAQTNADEATLFIRQDDVKLDWTVQLNGRKLGTLFLMEQSLVQTLPVPPGFLRNGDNVLSVLPPNEIDDIIVSDIILDSPPVQEALTKTKIEVQVSDKKTGEGLPCRITIVDDRGALAANYSFPGQALAVRPGVIYARDGRARLGLLPGKYTVYATRGMEYGLAQSTVTLSVGQSKQVHMQLAREVPTSGWLACDTHIHTFTYARHGDATLEERMLTLAGEGIELPISTEHNVLVDFSEPARRMKVEKLFTPVVGCEVTTAFGHFNAFPIEPGTKPPDFHLSDSPSLMKSIRATPGVQVIVLNHPRDSHANFRPFAATNFNPVSGENLRGPEFTFDAMEVINSAAMQSDWMLPFRDWFALLNHGFRVTALATSDSHDVSRFIVGQGRSYLAGNDSDPHQLNVAQACDSIRRGRVLVSLGLLTKMTIDGKFSVGALATGLGPKFQVQVEVLVPSWVQADRVQLFANGIMIQESRLDQRAKNPAKDNPTARTISWTLSRPAHDVFLVAVASGPGVTAPYWPIARPYQPTSRAWDPPVIGATNPIWLDADGDGKFRSARDYAKNLLSRFGSDPARFLLELAKYDEAICVQAASLCQSAGRDIRAEEFVFGLKTSSDSVRHAFARYTATLP
jgi:hypothetical protein